MTRLCHFCKRSIPDNEKAVEAKTKNGWAHFECWYDGGPLPANEKMTLVLNRDECWSLLYAIELGFGESGNANGVLAEINDKFPSARSAVGMLWCDARDKLRAVLSEAEDD